MRLLPEYKGVRVRPYMRRMSLFLFLLLFVLCMPIIALYVYSNWEAYQALDVTVIVITIILIVAALALSAYMQWFLQEATPIFKKCERLKRLARFLFENGYVYEKSKQKGKRKVSFPKVYLRQRKYDLEVSFEMAGGKYQNRFKKIGGELEDTFFMDFMETTDDYRFKRYKLAYSAFLNRITIPDVTFEAGRGLKLMKNLYWDFTSDPHMLVVGGTGGGKTVFLRSVILGLAKVGVVDICDPKRADFVTMSDLPAFQNRVVFEIEEIIAKFENAVVIMMARYDFMRREMKRLGHKDLKRYDEYGLEPYFLVCDEYNALMSMLSYRQREPLDNAIGQLLLLGRQAGCFGVIAMQKPSREDLGSKLQANINFRVSLGRLDETGYDLAFGDVNRNKEFKYLKYVSGRRVYGRGYAAVFGEVAREFYSPLLAKNFSFYDAFEKLVYHQNSFDPSENTAIDKDIVHNAELLDFAQKATEKQVSKQENEAVSVLTSNTMSLKQAAEVLEVSRPQLFKILKSIEDAGYTEFTRDDSGQMVLSEMDFEMVVELYALKADSDLTWSATIDKYFTEGE